MELLDCAVYLLCLGFLVQCTGNMLPRSWFHPEAFPFKTAAWEQGGKAYRKVKVHKWKDRVPDASRRDRKMVQKKTGLEPDSQRITRLIQETCVAEFSHWLLMVLSLPVTRIYPGLGGRIVWYLCIAGNLVFVIIQRYNRPRLQNTLTRVKAA